MRILVFTTLWPNREQPGFGIFVRNRVLALARAPGVSVRVVAPAPYFPAWLNGRAIPEKWVRLARVPEFEIADGLSVHHPRYFNPPKIGMNLYDRWMADAAFPLIERLNREEPIDLIDAHYVYPDGAAAVRIAEKTGIGVVVTARGTDINLFTEMPMIRRRIRRTLARADGLIAVSAALRDRMAGLGIPREKIAVISNGIDDELFRPIDRDAARSRLDLPREGAIVLAVASLVPLKRIDLLIRAFSMLDRDDARLIVIGEGHERQRLEALAGEVSAGVSLIGHRDQRELPLWYSAADLLCLTSSREGSPNVLREALACGLPIVASDVGGVAEIIDGAPGCQVVADLNEPTLAREISQALDSPPPRDTIAAFNRRSWSQVAGEILEYYERIGFRSRAAEDRESSGAG